MKDFLLHLFVPRHSNNHRSKLLHSQSLLFFIAFLLLGQFFVSSLRANFPSVLGVSTNISMEQLLDFTNQKRKESGLGPLVINPKLEQAAKLKSADMILRNYWAHNGPDGTTPWVFVKKADYEYVYAGENLARGFYNAKDVVDAWMASPTHRDNMLSPNYHDIGFSITNGKLLGENTALVVEMFGSTQEEIASGDLQKPSSKEQNIVQKETVDVLPVSTTSQAIIDSKSLTQTIGIVLLSVFIFVLILDMFITNKKKVVRHVGHNSDHIVFFSMMLLAIILIGRGIIL